jgi:RNA polymerase sigma-70 factor (ECF subfamily)
MVRSCGALPQVIATRSRCCTRATRLVAAYLVRRCRDPELAADLTAETFAAAIVNAHRFRDDGQSALGWLLGIGRNLLGHAWQRGQIERRARQRLGIQPGRQRRVA